MIVFPFGYFPVSSHAITSDLSISEVAAAAELFLSDGVIVTGSSTGQPASKNELKGNIFADMAHVAEKLFAV